MDQWRHMCLLVELMMMFLNGTTTDFYRNPEAHFIDLDFIVALLDCICLVMAPVVLCQQ